MHHLELLDYFFLPFVLGIIYLIAYRIRDKYYPKNHPWRKIFIPALSLKIFGAVFNGILHNYYYGGGDTFAFFYHSDVINSSISESFIKWINLLLRLPEYESLDYYKYTSQMYWYNDTASYTVAAIGAVISIFTFNTYLPTAAIFAFISFSGAWAMFRTFARLYPNLVKQVAFVTLFIPTTILWGSGVYKDTICMFGLGWLTYGVFRLMVQKDFSIANILLSVVSFLLIANVKIYILIAFLPALGMWILFNYTQPIKNKFLKSFVKIFTISVVAVLSMVLMSVYSKALGTYSLDNLVNKAEETRQWIHYSSELDDGSSYTLGDIDPSMEGMFKKFPAAVNVTLFRPYPWEAKKVIMVFSVIESILFLYLTLRVLFIVRLKKFGKAIAKDPTIQFCLIFSIIFAFAVGVSTYNFGSLSRYKIPCLPFYGLAMILIFYKFKPATQKILPPFF